MMDSQGVGRKLHCMTYKAIGNESRREKSGESNRAPEDTKDPPISHMSWVDVSAMMVVSGQRRVKSTEQGTTDLATNLNMYGSAVPRAKDA